jgi:sugar O-acyltransferase (sialic acid O-acetyltransferase NeuD family)
LRRAPLLLLGAGGHAASCIDVIEQHGGYDITGLVGAAGDFGLEVLGHKVIGVDADLPALLTGTANALVAVGQLTTPTARMRLYQLLCDTGFILPAIVSARAYVSRHAQLGPGSIVMHGAVVNARATVGCNCIINSHALVEHDAVVADHCHVATAAIVNGGARIGSGTFLGSGSCVRESVTVGERCVIGMGQDVRFDCASDAKQSVSAR